MMLVSSTTLKDNGEASLLIAESSVGDAGIYAIHVGSSKSELRIDVIFSKPVFTVPLVDQQAQVGKSITFSVSVIGVPRPAIVWRFDRQAVGEEQNEYQLQSCDGTASLTVVNVTEKLIGAVCECVATNTAGETVCTAVVLPGWWHGRPFAACSSIRLRFIG